MFLESMQEHQHYCIRQITFSGKPNPTVFITGIQQIICLQFQSGSSQNFAPTSICTYKNRVTLSQSHYLHSCLLLSEKQSYFLQWIKTYDTKMPAPLATASSQYCIVCPQTHCAKFRTLLVTGARTLQWHDLQRNLRDK